MVGIIKIEKLRPVREAQTGKRYLKFARKLSSCSQADPVKSDLIRILCKNLVTVSALD